LANIKAPKNGYAYIYLSNQSNNDVYFDNLQAGITQGNIAEENHYYAYGLKISTLSSKKLGDVYEGSLKNNYLYQGAYSELDDDIGWTDFSLRNYDAQIGRWVQQDPYQQFASPYVGMGDDPINNTDPSGGIVPIGGMSQTAATAITLGEVVIRSVSTTTKAVSSLGNILLKGFNIATKVYQVANILNNSFNTIQPGDRTLIYARGMADAMFNAKFVGIHDAIWGTNLSDYDDPYDKEAYLKGRIAGDAVVIALAAVEIDAGISGGAALSIVTGGTSVVAGAAVAAYGAVSAGVATADAAWATVRLLKLDLSVKTSGSAGTGSGRVAKKPSSSPPQFAKDAKWGKNSNGKWGWKDKKGNFITKGDKPGEWHVNPSPNTRKPLWQGEKPRGNSNNKYWNVKDDGTIHH